MQTNETIPHPVFTYVENWTTPAQILCLQSLLRFSPQATVFDPDSFAAIADAETVSLISKVNPVHRSDVVRIWLLLKFGGLWIDADCIHMKPLKWIGREDSPGLCFADNRRDRIATTVLYSPTPEHLVYQTIFECQKELIKSGKPLDYLDLGSECIEQLSLRQEFDVLEHWEYMYVDWFDSMRFFHRVCDADVVHNRDLWSPNAFCHHLTGSVLRQMSSLTRDEAISQQNLLGFLFRRAEGMLPDIIGNRVHEILNRMPDRIRNYSYVEIGVLAGDTATVVAQQRPNSHIVAVDPWRRTESVHYSRTQDKVAEMSDNEHQVMFKKFEDRSWFFKDRLEVRRTVSVDAALYSIDESHDIVFIDAEHSFEGVTTDIQSWWPKVKPGGWIGGHDYAAEWPEVVKAVNSWSTQLSVSVELGCDSTWWVKKAA